jgi:hypothetical protein
MGRLQYELLLISFTVFELAALVKSIKPKVWVQASAKNKYLPSEAKE